ncbi:2-amino-4-hydroxy-6-hydroxymethyldihydropteridine diphosphokinase [Parashewanella spongiae]|uniref:2-amino-4-hydroxy-6-hydroxymethyldihydropteridine diphosphokinase n=1 Tax=Parashewanella spongiae TaxID=342950 RepID=A0A3A6TWX7_9GAMM|nr:2-amino-4-hydroxy-6-hydroxymethyldihydropteridine diphosphokinase [Parashewanella spongiae]MCL1078157.1 2-amino-4-hydroxy-6-hydroxymethyldihydropteridine diphosphokinase [Parashewanella spongiae]RJY16330.1 2-amino-4-hydroxy-6-hydroxymethyldihydropteridine diphosphokinase [Parashewanella spongiae]
MAQIYISVGSNIEPDKYIRSGTKALETIFGKLILSSIYQSEAVGFEGGDFLNSVVGATTDLSVAEVVEVLKTIEKNNGRKSNAIKFSSRTLDLDLLLYDDQICMHPVQLPRPEITYNAFVLWPMAEIAPELIHPETHQDFQSMWEDYDKASQNLKPIAFKWKN